MDGFVVPESDRLNQNGFSRATHFVPLRTTFVEPREFSRPVHLVSTRACVCISRTRPEGLNHPRI